METRAHMPLTIAVLQQKGGSGKTTLAVNLAASAHLSGLKTLIIDMDRQASAFDWSAARQDGSKLEGLAVVKADRALAVPRFREISRPYDCILLDGPPRLGEVTQSAAVLADVALLPIQPGPFDFWAVAETIELLDRADEIRAQLGRGAIRRAFVLNRAARGTRLARDGETELRLGGQLVGIVHQRIAFPDSASRGESVLTTPGALLAAVDVQKLWRAVKAKSNVPESKKAKPRAARQANPNGSRQAERG